MACQAYCDKEIGEAEVLRNEASEKARNPSVDSATPYVRDALKNVIHSIHITQTHTHTDR